MREVLGALVVCCRLWDRVVGDMEKEVGEEY